MAGTMRVMETRLLLLLWALFVFEVACTHRSAPRVHLAFKELMDTRTARPFSFSFNTSDYRILHVDPDQGRLYLGSREYLVSLDMQNINKEPLIIHWPAPAQRKGECQLTGKGRHGECANFVRLIEPWNRTHLYTCGTGAYKPICTFINRGWRAEDYLFRLVPGYVDSGKGKCSYDPNQENVASLINGNLYAGVAVDFMSTDPGIFRTMGSRPAVRSEQYDSKWLNEPVFVQMKQISDSSEKNDDKLYFFFREKSLDSGGGASPSVLARVGRVCLNDEGGQKSLVNKWTTFLKARLVCSVMGDDGVETFFDELRDVFIQPSQDERNPIVYGVFSTSGSVFKGSAVCVYSMADIRNVFNGPFAHKHGHNYQWTTYTGKIPYPRPGTCPGGTFTPGLQSTKEFSDEAVNFIRAHPLMYHPVYPIHKRPLVVRSGVDYRFTTIAVDQVDAVDGRYEVLFLGTDRGTVQKVIVLPKDPTTMEELTLEEVEVFRTPAPVKTMHISAKRQQLYASSEVGLTQMSLHRCGVYGKACSDCCLARDPYCAWDGDNCSAFTQATKRRSRRQDVKHGDPLRQCRGYNAKVERRLKEKVQFGVEGSSTFLECVPRSPQATIKWLYQKEGRRKVLNRDGEVLRTPQGVLLKALTKADAGQYHCLATENNFKHTLARVSLRILDRDIAVALTTPDEDEEEALRSSHKGHQHQPAPPTPALLLEPEMRLIQQYCQSYWEQLTAGGNPRAELPKRTNRRHTEESEE
ncbi:sema domain, immunoglobulin domain (Ig), short basic domain, secreted, (semaphorin) 3Ga isoform X1 [Danio rerio]|uniref:sema domain, immunoglobulin domain (Ig), short basic domain, secreted, (semaphorin) 3Ga isoform X1 n=1 Tax=Danio rerio TaxID=7955 RepID=UPI0000568112|nr:sema domain, immunoglobulin domain (Ig), short basic domain, secreted, (semaphorin) 3Ga isoform X1 [Danio rerio]AAI63710.1 Semaphorin 3ga [Danio rerio]AAI63715.1 Semaphorin 3ga [Danio rerio]|eukprot:XP_005167088.1 sema domain, immunoglobulin domain (Ig), short basic domain, secreted, (semaphorin) 3Ga isoform X1 [Danio rerio]